MHPLSLNQKINFHLQTSTTTTTVATSNTTQTIVKGGYSSVIPTFLGETETKSIAERTVTNAAQSCRVPKPGKKKKKPVTSTQQAEAINQLGAPFALSRISPPADVQKTSLFSEPGFSKLDAAEKILLKDLLDQSYLCQNMNLFEVFITDFWTQQEALISLVEAYDKEKIMDELARFLNCHHIVLQIYKLYLYTFGKEKNDLGVPLPQFHAHFFQSVPGMGVWLESYSKNLNLLITKINLSQAIRRQGKFKSVIALYEQKFKPLHACLQLLDRKSKLLTKCLEEEGVDKLFVTKKISAWSESCKSDDPTQQFATLTKFTTFIKYFSRMGAKDNIPAPGSLDEKIVSYIHIIEEMIASKFSKKTTSKFILAYKDYSHHFLQSQLLMVDHIKSIQKDPSFSHKQTFNTSNEGLLEEDMESLHTFTLLNTIIIDKWMNDLHHIISGHFLAELREIHVIEPQAYIKRLLMMFELVNKNYQFEDRLPDPSLEPINDLMKKLTAASDLQYKSTFMAVSFSEIASKLQSNFSAQPFYLSGCLLALSPIEAILKDGVNLFQLDQLRHEILQGVLVAKQNHQLDHWKPQKLKEAIQETLFQHCFPLCIYTMIIADTKALISKNHPNDILHLLPNDVVRLLDLSGFDDIFSEKSSVASVEEAVAVDSNLALEEETEQSQEPVENKINLVFKATSKKSPISAPKPITMPDKEDFQNTTKRRVIVRMLERMNFLFERTGRHDIYRHSETSGIVVLPHVLPLGTRRSVFNQALAALPRQEGKAEILGF